MGKNFTFTAEQNAAKSQRMKGHTVSEETRRKLREAAAGRHPSAETRRKQSAATKGRPKSQETRQRMKEAQANRDPAINQRIAASLRGRKLSPEHIEAQRITKKATGTWKPIGYTYTRRGYRWLKVAEGQGPANYIAEHRHVIEQMLGRPLLSSEHVHHLDGNTLNNAPDNLALVSKTEHSLLNKLLQIIDEHMAVIIISTLKRRFPRLDL